MCSACVPRPIHKFFVSAKVIEFLICVNELLHIKVIMHTFVALEVWWLLT